MKPSLWVIDSTYNAIPGVSKATVTIKDLLEPYNSTPVPLAPKYEGHIHKAWTLGVHELVICSKVTNDSGLHFRFDHYATTDVKGFYLREVTTIMDSYIHWVG